MRKVSGQSRKIAKFFEKSNLNFDKGFKRALNFEINGVRFCGQNFDYLTVADNTISFGVGKDEFNFPFDSIKKLKRLRTKKFLFFVELEKKAKKTVEKKIEKLEEEVKKVKKPKKEDEE